MREGGGLKSNTVFGSRGAEDCKEMQVAHGEPPGKRGREDCEEIQEVV